MPRRPYSDYKNWTPEDDAVLAACWPDPDIDFAAIAGMVSGERTVGAVKHRGYRIGLGRKARRAEAAASARKLTAWPDDMPRFEDHPDAAAPGPLSQAVRQGLRYGSVRHDMAASPTGSTFDGAAVHPAGRRVRAGR